MTFFLVPLESVAVAVSCREAPIARLAVPPLTATDVTVGVQVAAGQPPWAGRSHGTEGCPLPATALGVNPLSPAGSATDVG